MFSWNLRNKEYCFFNEQLSKEEYEQKKSEWDISSRKNYDKAKKEFLDILLHKAYHRAQSIDRCQNSTGDFLDRNKNALNCYFIEEAEDCVNSIRGGSKQKDTLDALCGTSSELTYYTSLVGESYQVRFSFQLLQCRFVDYSAFCFQCKNCFGCCGLVGKKYHIFNKEYSPEEYEVLKEKIIQHMKSTGEWGHFFPGYFSPNSYDESWSSFYYPLTDQEKKQYGFPVYPALERKEETYLSPNEIPDKVSDLSPDEEKDLSEKIFWDSLAKRRFQVSVDDIEFSKKVGVPLPNTYYVSRMQENFRWLPFTGALRKTTCAESGKEVDTSWPSQLDGRILSEEKYLEMIG